MPRLCCPYMLKMPTHCALQEATQAWYSEVLGIEATEYGGFSFAHAASAACFPKGARTILSPFSGDR